MEPGEGHGTIDRQNFSVEIIHLYLRLFKYLLRGGELSTILVHLAFPTISIPLRLR
jgi:hypothetical protein